MEPSRFRQRLQDGEVLLGLLSSYCSATIIETIGSGWDFVWIDAQHGHFSCDGVLQAVRAADLVGVDSLLRVASQDPGILGLHADMFPSGLMVPMVNTAKQAAEVASALRFPPLGSRSFGGRRPIDFLGRNYHRGSEPLLVVQIETPEAVENANEIIATDGVDALFLGTDDLKVQMGIPVDAPNSKNEAILQATHRVGQAARNAGKFAGCIASDRQSLRLRADAGYQLLVGGADASFLRISSRERLQILRQALE